MVAIAETTESRNGSIIIVISPPFAFPTLAVIHAYIDGLVPSPHHFHEELIFFLNHSGDQEQVDQNPESESAAS